MFTCRPMPHHTTPLMQALRDAGSSNPEPRQEPTGLPLATLQWTGRSMCAVPDGFATHPDIHGLLSARRCAARMCTVKCSMQHAGGGSHSSWQAGSVLSGVDKHTAARLLPGALAMSIGVPRGEHRGHVCCSVSSSPSDLSLRVPHGRRRMVAGEDSRVDFGMAEALALGTLALHRGRRPGGCEFGSDMGEQAASPAEARTLAPAVRCHSSCVGRVQG